MSNSKQRLEYHQILDYIKELRLFFSKKYESYFKLGAINQSSPDFTYFSLTTEDLKKQKLKFVLIFNHQKYQFEICLSGQNKEIRKRYWELFHESDWNKYHVPISIKNNLMIVSHTIIPAPDFSDKINLTKQVEAESMEFINDLQALLD